MAAVASGSVDVGRRLYRLRRNIGRPAKKFGIGPLAYERVFRRRHAQRRRADAADSGAARQKKIMSHKVTSPTITSVP